MKKQQLMLLLFLFFVSCTVAKEGTDKNSPTVTKEETHKNSTDVASVSGWNGYADFAFDLYRQRAQEEDGNLVFSPLSITAAFSMVYAGAQGKTEAELMNGLHFLPQAEHHPNFEALIKQINLNSTSQGEQKNGTPFQLVIANAVWGQEAYPFKQPYLDLLANSYQAPLQRVDFGQPQADRINSWIAEQTHGKITELVPQDVLTSALLVLTNAIYLKGSWLIPFDKSETKNEQFHLSDGGVVDVPMMQSGTTLRTGYVKGDGYQVVQLPYVGESADMLVILPDKEKFDQLVTQLNGSWLSQLISQFQQHDVNLKMPRFAIDQKLPLKEALIKLGVVDAFDADAADFSNMADRGLYVSAALHQTTLVVNEEGSEATAATVVALAERSFPKAEMIMDRPFLFAIVDRKTSTIFFLGRVVNPVE